VVFLLFRMAQAVIVAGLVLSRAVVRDMVPLDEAASKIGYVTMGMALVPMISPMVGGVMEEMLGWRSTFYPMLVLGLLIYALVWADLGETAEMRGVRMIDQIREYPGLLTARRFWGYSLTAAFTAALFFAFLGGAPFIGIEVFGLSPSLLGFYFGAPAVGYALGNLLTGIFSRRYGINRMILVGALIGAGGIVLLIALWLPGLAPAPVFFGTFILTGIANGLVMPNATAGLLSVRPRLAGAASGLGGAVMLGGGATFSALSGVLLQPGSGPLPLLFLMLVAAILSVLSILYVIRREKALRG
jgi:DHA1 family bicyclomycin/chloramphenicol resistance-like MFS transporter